MKFEHDDDGGGLSEEIYEPTNITDGGGKMYRS